MKITLAQLFLSLDLDLLLVDADAIVVGDVMAYFKRYPEVSKAYPQVTGNRAVGYKRVHG